MVSKRLSGRGRFWLSLIVVMACGYALAARLAIHAVRRDPAARRDIALAERALHVGDDGAAARAPDRDMIDRRPVDCS